MMLEPVKKNIVDTLLEQAPDIEYLEVLAPNLAGDLWETLSARPVKRTA